MKREPQKKHPWKIKLESEIDRTRLFTFLVFVGIITILAWQSDDAYHGYVMAKHLVDGHGFVYNIGERSSASSCPLFTLVIAAAYFVTREMFFTSLAVCIAFSAGAYYIVAYKFCRTKEQIILSFFALTGSTAFVSYTTSGLENSMLFFLSALFLKNYFESERFDGKQMLKLALIFSAIALTRMDAVLMFIPVIVYIYLAKREKTGFPAAVGIGFLGLLPFFLWELFSLFYFGFPVPNTAYVKLGTDIALMEYVKRGIWYGIFTLLNDLLVIVVPAVFLLFSVLMKKAKYLYLAAGVLLYVLYVVYIGGDFMMGRHFTVVFLISVCGLNALFNRESDSLAKIRKYQTAFGIIVVAGIVYTNTFAAVIGSQYLFGHEIGSSISDEREVYQRTTGLFNNIRSLLASGELSIWDTWNYQSTDEIRELGLIGNITDNSPGILVYYNSDLYLNDTYGLGDPFLSKLPAIKDENWRVGHMKRALPEGYRETIQFGENVIENEDLARYYDVIRLITRGDLFDQGRIQAVIDWNLGKYDYLIDNYEASLSE